MIYYVYVIYNKKIQAYERPIVTYHDNEEFVEFIKRDYLASDKQVQTKLHENVVFYLGTYDDSNAAFDLIEAKNPIFDVGSLEVKPYGGE